MKKTICKRIYGALIFTFALLLIETFTMQNVEALSTACQKQVEYIRANIQQINSIDSMGLTGKDLEDAYEKVQIKLLDRYDFLDESGIDGDKLVIKLKTGAKDAKFKIVSVTNKSNEYDENNLPDSRAKVEVADQESANDSDANIVPNKQYEYNIGYSTEERVFEVKIESINAYKFDENLKNDCKYNKKENKKVAGIKFVYTLYFIEEEGDITVDNRDFAFYSTTTQGDMEKKGEVEEYCAGSGKDDAFCKMYYEAKGNSNTKYYIIDEDSADYKKKSKAYTLEEFNKYVEELNLCKGDDGCVAGVKKKMSMSEKQTLKYACDPTAIVKNSAGMSNDKDYYISENTNYVVGMSYQETPVVYKYHTEKGDEETETTSCKLKCHEVVKTEYGPPVAVISGLCFEYKIKVTSRVYCDAAEAPRKPKDLLACSPKPRCTHRGGKVYSMAGPNEAFDNCVNVCDGGEYSDECVNKCYKEIYEIEGMNKTSGSEISYIEKVAEKSDPTLYTYVYTKDGKITWNNGGVTVRKDWNGNPIKKGKHDTNPDTRRGSNNGDSKTDSYYHLTHNWGTKKFNTKYTMYYNGIPGKDGCKAASKCSWVQNVDGCRTASGASSDAKIYLNVPGVYQSRSQIFPDKYKDSKSPIEQDYEDNKKAYEDAYKSCKAQAKCNTKTATFNINVKYTTLDKNGKKDQTITTVFPYSTKNATIYNTDNPDDEQKTDVKCEDSEDPWRSIFISYDGCYGCGKTPSDERYYKTEWGFPGYWYYIKGNKIVIKYEPQSGTKYTKSKYKEYCLPTSTKDTKIMDVNTKWWDYYDTTIHGKSSSKEDDSQSNKTITCYNGKKLDNACTKTSTTTTKSIEKEWWYNSVEWDYDKWKANATADGYNIYGQTTDFGYFNWDIKVQCFYAKKEGYYDEKEVSKSKTSDDNKCVNCCPPCDPKGGDKAEVKTSDTKNLFPDKSGNLPASSSETVRTAGWNWTNQVKMSNDALGGKAEFAIQSDPEALIKWIQSDANGTGTYTDKNLDYQITLTKSDINKIVSMGERYTQAWSDPTNYINYKNDVRISAVDYYSSPLLRKELNNTKLPEGAARKCNNMKNYKSNECENIHGEGK